MTTSTKKPASLVAEGVSVQPYQVLFDENHISGTHSHANWQLAWKRAVAYAWASDENEAELLDNPEAVLTKFNYDMPEGCKLAVIRANDAIDASSLNISRAAGNLKYSANTSFNAYKLTSQAEHTDSGLIEFSVSKMLLTPSVTTRSTVGLQFLQPV